MDRFRLILFIACALLTTTLGPFGLVDAENPTVDSLTTETGVSPLGVDALARSDEARPSSDTHSSATKATESALAVAGSDPESPSIGGRDSVIASQIFNRLAMRHTALPERELRGLVHTIIREAHRNNLEPALVVAVIEVESAGYHLAVSRVGAMGLMQLLPSTAEEIAGRLGIEWKGADTLFDPTINVQLGTAYLSHLAKRYGNVDTALAAYNWGPGRIDRRLRRGATVPSRYIEQVMRAFDRNAMVLVRQS